MNTTILNQSQANPLKMSQNNYMLNHTQAHSDYGKSNPRFDQKVYQELCGCAPTQIVPIIKFLLIFIMLGALIGFILSIVGACYDGSSWMGSQPTETYALFITDIILCVFIFGLALFAFIQLMMKNFELGIKVELTLFFVFVFLACSLAGGIIIQTIDQSSSVSYSCSQVYQKIWPSSVLDASQTAQANFCSGNCPCDYSSQSQSSYPLAGYFDPSGPINALGCKQYTPLSQSTVNLLQNLESSWKCAGICSVSKMYLFTDVNRGQPNSQQSCFQIASQKLYPLSNLFLGGDFTISILQMIILLFLMKLKTFLDRDDVRLFSGVKTIDQERQHVYATSIIQDPHNQSIAHDQSSIIRQDHQQSMIQNQQLYQQEQVIQQQPPQVYQTQQNQTFVKKNSFIQPLHTQMNALPAATSNQQSSQPVISVIQKQNSMSAQSAQVAPFPNQNVNNVNSSNNQVLYKQNSITMQNSQIIQNAQYNSQKTASFPNQGQQITSNNNNQVVPLKEVLNNNGNQNQIYQQNQNSDVKTDIEYQYQRDIYNTQGNQINRQPTLNQKIQNYRDDFDGQDQSPSSPMRSSIVSPKKNNYIERKQTIEHTPVNNLFDDDVAQNKNRNNLNNSIVFQNKAANHPLSQLQQNRLTSSSFQNASTMQQSPIRKGQQQTGGLSVLANTGNLTLQSRNVATPVMQSEMHNDDTQGVVHNLDMVKPKSNNNTYRPQSNVVSLNLDPSAPNSSYQLNDAAFRSTMQNQSTVSNGNNNTNKKFFSKQNQNNNIIV
ncbi:transmembrane protein, putative (macronuclear) [Tetrahymena thermophila SB210]|uniref:Transmembrane protein, putative n=1 Tax=Tetrahymena thermophila (strain SB210) TaxID=312017 RepID=Q22CW4_TETTS|nr:transmembrane protein, putative [Tetrahymena thermophila SB210]EAR83155.2 transmembrane protein, putative [Tetrahymena thermophila SB210]|eukprot:XP_001030818.2 transmembrane protein, putative [Tetrahymena thermophila SB210]